MATTQRPPSHSSWLPTPMSPGKEAEVPRVSETHQGGTWPVASTMSGVFPAPLLPGPGDRRLKASGFSQGLAWLPDKIG